MSKKQRGVRRPPARYGPATTEQAGNPSGTGDDAAAAGSAAKPAPIKPGSITTRSARRRTQAPVKQPSLFDRYRAVFLVGFALVGVLVIFIVVNGAGGGGGAAYACTTLLTPGPVQTLAPAAPSAAPSPSAASAAPPSSGASPAESGAPAASPDASASPAASPSPAPAPTPQLGFATSDLGKTHVDQGTKVTYGFCPPTSGNHYNVTGQAPLPRQFYGPTVSLIPQNWIHNLEHGYVVILYKDTPPQDVLTSIQDVMNTAKGSATATSCQLPNKVIAARFDSMDTPFAVVAWDRALLLPQWDPAQAKTFAEQWQDSPQHPENTC